MASSPAKKTRRRSAPQPGSSTAGHADQIHQPRTATHAATTRRLSNSPSDGSGQVQQATPLQQLQATELPPLLSLPSLLEHEDEYGRAMHPGHIRYQLRIGEALHCSLVSPYQCPPLQLTLMLDGLLAHDSYTVLYRVSTLQPPADYMLRIFLSSKDLGLQGPAADCHDFQMAGVCAEELAILNRVYGNPMYVLETLDVDMNPFAAVGRVMVHGRHAMLLDSAHATLHQAVAAGPLPMAVFRDIAKQLIRNLELSDRIAIPHGNLTASNVLLRELPDEAPTAGTSGSSTGQPTRTMTYQVILLGYAPKVWFTGGNGVPGTCSLTGPYSRFAPEMDEGHAHTPAADRYQLGMLLLEMLTGINPYEWLRTRRMLDNTTPTDEHLSIFMEAKASAAHILLDCKHHNAFVRALPSKARTFVKPLLAKDASSRTSLLTLGRAAFLTSPPKETQKRKRGTEPYKNGRRKQVPLIDLSNAT